MNASQHTPGSLVEQPPCDPVASGAVRGTIQAMDVSSIVTYRSWWPASVVLPDRTVRHRCRVYATSIGVLMYERRPSVMTPDWGALTPDWFSPIDWAATTAPNPSQLPGSAVDIHTNAGLIVITYTGGCGCGNPLRNWRPQFSTQVGKWPVAVAS